MISGTDSRLCPNYDQHTKGPQGHLDYIEWTREMHKTHTVSPCPSCGLFVIWKPKKGIRKETEMAEEVSTTPVQETLPEVKPRKKIAPKGSVREAVYRELKEHPGRVYTYKEMATKVGQQLGSVGAELSRLSRIPGSQVRRVGRGKYLYSNVKDRPSRVTKLESSAVAPATMAPAINEILEVIDRREDGRYTLRSTNGSEFVAKFWIVTELEV